MPIEDGWLERRWRALDDDEVLMEERAVGIHMEVDEIKSRVDDSFTATLYWYEHIVKHHDIEPYTVHESGQREFGKTPDGKEIGVMTHDQMKEWHDEFYGEHAHGYGELLLGVW